MHGGQCHVKRRRQTRSPSRRLPNAAGLTLPLLPLASPPPLGLNIFFPFLFFGDLVDFIEGDLVPFGDLVDFLLGDLVVFGDLVDFGDLVLVDFGDLVAFGALVLLDLQRGRKDQVGVRSSCMGDRCHARQSATGIVGPSPRSGKPTPRHETDQLVDLPWSGCWHTLKGELHTW